MTGKADLMEEIARIFGYDRIPESNMADSLPNQVGNRSLELEEKIRDLLGGVGLQEIVTYRITSPEAENRAYPQEQIPTDRVYIELANPISSDKTVMRTDLLASMLEIVEKNYRNRDRIALFEIGPEFGPSLSEEKLAEEKLKLGLVLTGARYDKSWQSPDQEHMDFFDLKGLIEELFTDLHITGVSYLPVQMPSFHPGKCAKIEKDGKTLGLMGEISPKVKTNYKMPDSPVLAAILEGEVLLEEVDDLFNVDAIPDQPPVLEDLALVVDENVPAHTVASLIKQTGGKTLREVKLFDVYRGAQLGQGKKSLAYSLVYQHPDKTLTDKEVAKIRNSIVKRLEKELGAQLRSW
jgi:phenylalanyl-tRNA synthetase beta chain